MIKSVAIYPEVISDKYLKQIKEYISLLDSYNYNEIFTTVHLPELSFEIQLECLKKIITEAQDSKLDIVTDVGGKYVKDLINSDIQGIDYIRLDCNFELSEVRELYSKLHLKGFIINASTYNEKEFTEFLKELKNIDEKMEIRCCHNFYVKEESGLDDIFAIKEDMMIKKHNLPVYYCIPSHNNPRGPLYLGLCTLEKHRHMTLDDIVADLYLNYEADGYLLSDMWFSKEELDLIDKTLNSLNVKLTNPVFIDIRLDEDITEAEKDIVLKEHVFRHDSPYNLLRSSSSRRMAEFANELPKRNTVKRKRGAITIDNILNRRYSGELSIVLDERGTDDRVNVVGYVDEKDIVKLRRYKEGYRYQFIVHKS